MVSYQCRACGATGNDTVYPVWENRADYGRTVPDYLACSGCGTMEPYQGPYSL